MIGTKSFENPGNSNGGTKKGGKKGVKSTGGSTKNSGNGGKKTNTGSTRNPNTRAG